MKRFHLSVPSSTSVVDAEASPEAYPGRILHRSAHAIPIMQPRTDLNIATLLIKTPTSHDSSSPRSPIISVKGESGNSASPDSAVEVAGEESR